MGNNAMNAMLAHKERVGNDNSFVRGIVDTYTLLGFGMVTKYSSERVEVSCGNMTFTNVEVMVFGVNGWGIKPVPAIGDRVLLFSTQTPVPDIKQFIATGSMPPYDLSGLKAIPVTDSVKASQMITVNAQGIEITGSNKLTVNAQGIVLTDANGNKITTDSSGVEIDDKNGNKFEMTSTGTKLTDKNSCTIESSSNGVVINNKLQIKK